MLIKSQRGKEYVRLRFFSCPFACITAVYLEHECSTTSSKLLLPAVLNSTYCFPKLREQQHGFTLWSKSLKAYQSSFLLSIVYSVRDNCSSNHKLSIWEQHYTITKLLGHGCSQFIAGDAFMFASYSYRRKLLQQ